MSTKSFRKIVSTWWTSTSAISFTFLLNINNSCIKKGKKLKSYFRVNIG